MRVTRTQSKRLLAILPIFVCIFLAACLPMKVPKQVQPVTGGILKSDPDISAIRVGLTTRAEIIQQFGDFDAGWKGERLFFGRWLRSGGVAVVGMYSDFNYTGRGWWIAHDLVIEFDGNGKVIRYSVLSDKQFLDELPTLLSAEEHPSEFQPRSGTSFKTVNTMGREFLDLVAIDRWWGTTDVSWSTRITREQIERLSTWPTPLSASEFGLDIHLRNKVAVKYYVSHGKGGTRRTNTLRLHADVPTIVLLVQFLHLPNAKP